MDISKKGGKVYVRPDGGAVLEEFIAGFQEGGIKAADACIFIRMEHPHCAFFMSTHSPEEGKPKRKTLYTPEGRLHIEYDNAEDKEVQVGRYVKKEDQLETLLFYLRDVEIKPVLSDVECDAKAILMPKTPMAEFISFVDDEVSAQAVPKGDAILKHIFSQLRRIYNAQLEILSQKINGTIECAVFDDVLKPDVPEELLEKWHYYYIRKARLLNK
jgi:hypothetical protein